MSKQARDLVAFAVENRLLPGEPSHSEVKGTRKNLPLAPNFVPLSELITKNLKEPPRLIEGLLHKGSKMTIGGGSKSFKTWIILDLALSVAAGEKWWGRDTTRSCVLYLNAELPEWTLHSRLASIMKARPKLRSESPALKIWNLRGHAAPIEEIVPALIERLEESVDLVIFDPIYKLYGDLDENSAGDMAKLLNHMDVLTSRTQAAIIFGAHFSKGNHSKKASMDRISGSGVFARDPDSIITLAPHKEADTFVVESTLRSFKPLKAFCVKWKFPLMEIDGSADPKQLKQANTSKYSEEQLMDALGMDTLTFRAWADRCLQRSEMSETTFRKYLKKVCPAQVTKNADGTYTAKNLTADAAEGETNPQGTLPAT